METTKTKGIDEMSIEELEALMVQKKKEQREKELRERQEYEKGIDKDTIRIATRAEKLHAVMTKFHVETVETLEGMREKLDTYGMIRGNSKGGFSRKSNDGRYKVVYRTSTLCDWDERAGKAETLLKDFLGDVVKKRDKELFELIVGLLEKNKEGKLEYSRMQMLYAKETLFDDPRWLEAIRLFKESFKPIETKMRIEIYRRNEVSKKWEPINLNLSGF